VKSDGIVFFFKGGLGGAGEKNNAKLILIFFTKILKFLDSPSSVLTQINAFSIQLVNILHIL